MMDFTSTPLRLSDDEFYDFCRQHEEYKLEKGSNGIVRLVSGTAQKTGMLNTIISYWLAHWHLSNNSGYIFDASTSFRLSNASIRTADAAWVSAARWEGLTDAERAKLPPVCPEFVIERMAADDDLEAFQKKMTEEWIANGCKLAWLIDPLNEMVFVYRENGEMQAFEGFDRRLSGENLLAGFQFDLSRLRI